jgi:hypothetical protein
MAGASGPSHTGREKLTSRDPVTGARRSGAEAERARSQMLAVAWVVRTLHRLLSLGTYTNAGAGTE